MKNFFNSLLLCAGVIMMLTSCDPLEIIDQGPEVEPRITTTKSSDIRVYYSEATLYATIRDYDSVKEVGFVYGTDENNINTWTKGTMSDGVITANITGLTPGKKYWYCAVAKTRRNTYYAEYHYSFITFPDGPVDLGLPSGLRWSGKNLGADVPTDIGNYYAWGETQSKKYYDWTQYKFWNGDNNVYVKSMTKYGTDGKTMLDAEDDAAHTAWGGKWRMPDATEISELFQYCDIASVTINGVEGVRLISKKTMDEENFIFFPVTGYIEDASLKTSWGVYFWSRTMYPFGNANYYSPQAYSGCYNLSASLSYGYRSYGETIRPVCE